MTTNNDAQMQKVYETFVGHKNRMGVLDIGPLSGGHFWVRTEIGSFHIDMFDRGPSHKHIAVRFRFVGEVNKNYTVTSGSDVFRKFRNHIAQLRTHQADIDRVRAERARFQQKQSAAVSAAVEALIAAGIPASADVVFGPDSTRPVHVQYRGDDIVAVHMGKDTIIQCAVTKVVQTVKAALV